LFGIRLFSSVDTRNYRTNRHYDVVLIRQFEEIEGWKEARLLASKIYEISNKGRFRSDFGLRDQIQRAAVSIMANIAEGFGRGGKAEFIRFLKISRASALETQSHLYIAFDLGYVSESEFDSLHAQVTRVMRLVGGFINYLSCDGTEEPNN
jgi:four helix bundle protein